MFNRLLIAGFVACLALAAFAFVGTAAPADDAAASTVAGGGLGACISGCEAKRQARFQACMDAGIDPDECAARANALAKRCKTRCRLKGTKGGA